MPCAVLLALLVAGCSGDKGAESRSRRVVLVPIGPVPIEVMTHLQRDLPAIIGRDVVIGAEIPRPSVAFQPARKQYLGQALLDELKRHDVPDADRVVGLVDADAYAPGLNFIFGQAEKPGRFAIVALPRFRESFRGQPENARKFNERALKVTIHELGHTLGFVHCPDRKCVMHFANSLRELDDTGVQYCSREKVPK